MKAYTITISELLAKDQACPISSVSRLPVNPCSCSDIAAQDLKKSEFVAMLTSGVTSCLELQSHVSLREECANNYIHRPPYPTVARVYVNRG